jgi:hypothetical protein
MKTMFLKTIKEAVPWGRENKVGILTTNEVKNNAREY